MRELDLNAPAKVGGNSKKELEALCKNCREPFTVKKVHQIYCTPRCRNLSDEYKSAKRLYALEHYYLKRKVETKSHPRNCKNCGVGFTTGNPTKIYCNSTCRESSDEYIAKRKQNSKKAAEKAKEPQFKHQQFR